eukprot:2345862-Amphidinium_carterae.1
MDSDACFTTQVHWTRDTIPQDRVQSHRRQEGLQGPAQQGVPAARTDPQVCAYVPMEGNRVLSCPKGLTHSLASSIDVLLATPLQEPIAEAQLLVKGITEVEFNGAVGILWWLQLGLERCIPRHRVEVRAASAVMHKARIDRIYSNCP